MTKNTKKPKASTAKIAAPTQVAAPAKAATPVNTAANAQPRNDGNKINHICLELMKPDAKTVCVAGSFNEWKPETTPLVSLGNGRWVGDLDIKPGRHEYLFVVDGQWLPDPNARESVANPFGGTNSVLIVSA